jgi:anti-anti-sigma regulatory factor
VRAVGQDAHKALGLQMELSHGRHGASARLDVYDRPDAGPGARRGWIDRTALMRLGRALDDMASRGVDQLVLDCAELRHVDYRMTRGLVERLERFETHSGVVVCGLSRHLRDLFRLAGCEGRLRCWPSADELLAEPLAPGPGHGIAS